MAKQTLAWLLRLLPREFRDGYAREVERTFDDEARDLAGEGRSGAVAGLWLATAVDVIRTAPGQHLDILRRDLTFALRAMAARPAHTATALLTLALGIGASVTMFTVIDAVLLAPFDYRDADRLVFVGETGTDGRAGNTGYLSFMELKARARSLSHLVAATQSTATFAGDGQDAERVNAMRVSADYFAMIGVSPVLGRAFTTAEDRPGPARQVVVLSDGLWRRRFRADPGAIGRVVDLGGRPFTVVGVMPRGFDDLVASRLYGEAALWMPLGYDPAASFACRSCRHLVVFGRLADGHTIGSAETELTRLYRAMAAEHPREYANPGARVQTLAQLFLGPVRPALWLLAGGVALLFLVVCANVASLLLLRASERASEVAVRAALGVTRSRLARQLLTESVLLSVSGALLGLLPAWVAVRVIAVAGPTELPRLADVTLDARAVVVAVLLATASGVLFGLAPLRQLLRRDAGDQLRGAGRRTGGAGVWRTRSLLVTGNVAMAAVLLTGSFVLVRSVSRLLAVDPGVRADGVLTMKVWAGGPRFSDGETPQQIAAAAAFYDDVLTRVRALPGVTSAAAVSTLPLSGEIDGYGFHVAGKLTANPEDAPSADRFSVAGDLFSTLGIPLLAGRLIDASDGPASERVVVVNDAAARIVFAGENPIGRQVMLGPPDAPRRTIVGVVGDLRHRGLDQAVGPQVYVPQAQWAFPDTLMTLAVRTAGDPLALAGAARAVVRDVDPAQPVTDVRRYDDVIAARTGTRRFVAGVLSGFAALALLLAVVGLYGALSVMVAQRRLEIGIRLALGARVETIRGMVFAHGLTPVAAGVLVGLSTALVVLPAAANLLFEVSPADPVALAATLGVLAVAGAAACAVPAWRAARIDPAASLRAE
jgi:putative ABC transport system permease protein